MAEENGKDGEDYKLERNSELRFEVDSRNEVHMEMIDGMAEVFGTEITKKQQYKFMPGSKMAVYTFHGCTIKLRGKTEVAYISKETPMTMYLNTHAAMEQMRAKADIEETRGPRVLVVGPTDVGKSTLCRLLVNYAVRCGRSPILADLDVGQGQVSVPGTLGAVVMEHTADVVEGYVKTTPLVFHFGHKSPADNNTLFNTLTSRMAEVINIRSEQSQRVNSSGVVINTGGWVRGAGYDALKHAAGSFEVDIIIVLDQERLYNQLKGDMPEFVKIVLLPKSGGVVERSQHARAEARDMKIRDYFYGVNGNLYPHSFDIKFNEIKLFKIGAPSLPESCLPLGMKASDCKTKLIPVLPTMTLLHHVLSISAANSVDQNIVESNILGFIVVTAVDMEKSILTVLSPAPRPLPKSILLVMDIQFMDIK
ncbi:polyribonucleotide 5'-hydroxyl-kinase Clp1-like [Babylonia areolata]|uniref:polyribonucleotide 5'-hydroxyl-kinase Clp1-like n=1 Tax=Babylonia areolata TaxID=304850 RepID=UPI003FD1AD4C